jgi:hypothetical protein
MARRTDGRHVPTLLFVVALGIATPRLVSRAADKATSGPAPATAAELAQIASDAYVFGYPLVTMYVTETVATNVARPTENKAPLGQLANARKYPSAAFREVTAPNADTLYSTAWLDLSKEPYVFSHPDMGNRYYLLPMLDAYTNVIEVPGTRTTGGKAATYMLTGPDWRGEVPRGASQVKSPTNVVWILGRTYCTGTPEDYQAVHALQDQFRLFPLSLLGRTFVPPAGKVNPRINTIAAVRDQVDAMSGGQFFLLLSTLMRQNPPAKADGPMVARMARLGLMVGEPFDASVQPRIVASAIATAPKLGQARIKDQLRRGAVQANGWVIATKTGRYGIDYDQRAFVAAFGLGANLREDALYPLAQAAWGGQRLSGNERFLMHFPQGTLPPVKGFWSLTMYDPKFFFVANPLNRFTLSARNALAKNGDGSVDLYLQNEKPVGHESNWLPAPPGDFVLMLRLYWPNTERPSVLDGSWRPPAITRQSDVPRVGREAPRKRATP